MEKSFKPDPLLWELIKTHGDPGTTEVMLIEIYRHRANSIDNADKFLVKLTTEVQDMIDVSGLNNSDVYAASVGESKYKSSPEIYFIVTGNMEINTLLNLIEKPHAE